MPNGKKLIAASSYDQQKPLATSGSQTPKAQSNEPKPQDTENSSAPKY